MKCNRSYISKHKSTILFNNLGEKNHLFCLRFLRYNDLKSQWAVHTNQNSTSSYYCTTKVLKKKKRLIIQFVNTHFWRTFPSCGCLFLILPSLQSISPPQDSAQRTHSKSQHWRFLFLVANILQLQSQNQFLLNSNTYWAC